MPAREPHDLLSTLQRLLDLPAGNLNVALSHAADVIADSLGADKVDAFLYDGSRDSLVAVGTSSQPLSALQKKLGLDVLQVSNGGRVVYVYKTGEVYRIGNLRNDPDELLGVREGLKVESTLGVPLDVGGERRGMMLIASRQRDYFTAADEAFARSAVRWVGSVAHRAELIEDIERKALEQGRRAAAEEIVTVLAHDLRNYIAPVMSRLYALHERFESSGRTEDAVEIDAVVARLSRLNALISDLLDVARIDRGLFELDLRPVDLSALAKEAAGSLSTAEHDIRVSATGRVMIWADTARVRQCLDNLLTNAIKHSPGRAPVEVAVSETVKNGAKWGQVEIIDQGPGVPEELLPRIFERFVSGGSAKGGIGLGLYLARRIAIAHGGNIRAEQSDGKGARFVVTFRQHRNEV